MIIGIERGEEMRSCTYQGSTKWFHRTGLLSTRFGEDGAMKCWQGQHR